MGLHHVMRIEFGIQCHDKIKYAGELARDQRGTALEVTAPPDGVEVLTAAFGGAA